MKIVQILMSTYNGEKFIEEQIDSILNQKDVNIKLLIRDDGSTDGTIELLNKYSKKYDNISYYIGKNIKSANSFFDLIQKSNDCDYYAFADQDDFWEEYKVINAIKLMEKKNNKLPKFYFSNLNIVDESLNYLMTSNIKYDISFESSLIKNPATGCTVMFDKKFRDIIIKIKPNYVIMHDWWLYCIANSIDCNVIYDKSSYIKYRQHANNVFGYESGIKKIRLRLSRFLHSDNSRLKQCIELLNVKNISDDKLETIKMLSEYKKKFSIKIKILFSKNIKTNDFITDILFKISVLFNKY